MDVVGRARMNKRYAIYDEGGRCPWVVICDTNMLHRNGVGVPVARVIRSLAGTELDALCTFTERRRVAR